MDSATSSAQNAHNANENLSPVRVIETNLSSSFGLRVSLLLRLRKLAAMTREGERLLMSSMLKSMLMDKSDVFRGYVVCVYECMYRARMGYNVLKSG
jgi:hypothetical protein